MEKIPVWSQWMKLFQAESADTFSYKKDCLPCSWFGWFGLVKTPFQDFRYPLLKSTQLIENICDGLGCGFGHLALTPEATFWGGTLPLRLLQLEPQVSLLLLRMRKIEELCSWGTVEFVYDYVESLSLSLSLSVCVCVCVCVHVSVCIHISEEYIRSPEAGVIGSWWVLGAKLDFTGRRASVPEHSL